MTIYLWLGFLVFVVLLLALDLGVLNRRHHVISAREALGWTAFWVAISLAFNGLVYVMYEHHWLGIGLHHGSTVGGRQAALEFFTSYLVEKSLSLDNIFVIALIFAYLGVPAQFQHRVLFWGILGALVMRGTMIVAGLSLINALGWMTYVFGGVLILTAFKMLFSGDEDFHPEKNIFVRAVRRIVPVTDGYREHHFWVRQAGRVAVTPLGLAIVLVESSDVLFAVDSIPAVFAVTRDPFIVFTSNVCAILGLRSLYFALAAIMHRFRYLKMSLVFLLGFIGVKMLLAHHYPIPSGPSLVMIVGILAVGILASVLSPKGELSGPRAFTESIALREATFRHVRKIFVVLAGFTLVIMGILLLVLPGPGLLTIVGGLALLGTEFVWARRLLVQLQVQTKSLARKSSSFFRKESRSQSDTGTPPTP
jgi:tellurite resistance protein TerC